jgi:hypothetical protein
MKTRGISPGHILMIDKPVAERIVDSMERLKALNRTAATGVGLAEFRQQVRSAVYGAWSGKLTPFDATDTLILAVERAFLRAWTEGARQLGIEPQEWTIEERNRLQSEINDQIRFVFGFINDVVAKNRASRTLLRTHIHRAELWTMRYNQIVDLARTMAKDDQKLVWTLHAQESCPDCLHLAGRVHRASVWRRYGCLPRAPRLNCMASAHGVPVCKCELLPTLLRASPGHPPRMGAVT